MQYRRCVGAGPSSNTWPRCAAHSLHDTAVLTMPKLTSLKLLTFSGAIGCQKLGQPVPESNFVSELNNALSQQMQRYRPLSCRFQYFPEYASSVSAWRVMSKAFAVSCFRHSSSLLTTFGTRTVFSRSPASENSTTV